MAEKTCQSPFKLPFDPHDSIFPSRKDLPKLENAPDGAAWVWGPEDGLGRLNLVTPTRIAAAARSQIVTGETARLDLPLNVPARPIWGREPFGHYIKAVDGGVGHDDVYTMNTQSSTQWDGFRHMCHTASMSFYNDTKPDDITGPKANDKIGIDQWSNRGIAGRGILLDYRSYTESQGLVFDSATAHAITYDDLVACGKFQGIDIRPANQGGDIEVGDFLFIRSGFVQDYYSRSQSENDKICGRTPEVWAGLGQSSEILDWLHDCYFAAVAGDAPAFERWPSTESYKLHEYLLALWGVPIGEMLDLEMVSALAKKHSRWTFFFTTAPANCPRGVGSPVNGTAIF